MQVSFTSFKLSRCGDKIQNKGLKSRIQTVKTCYGPWNQECCKSGLQSCNGLELTKLCLYHQLIEIKCKTSGDRILKTYLYRRKKQQRNGYCRAYQINILITTQVMLKREFVDEVKALCLVWLLISKDFYDFTSTLTFVSIVKISLSNMEDNGCFPFTCRNQLVDDLCKW